MLDRSLSISHFTYGNFRMVSLDNDQLDAPLIYFTISLLQSCTCFEHYMLILRRFNCIDAASDNVLSVSGRPVHKLRENCRAVLSQPVHWTATDWEDVIRCCINTVKHPEDEHVMLETCRGLQWTYCKINQVCIKLVLSKLKIIRQVCVCVCVCIYSYIDIGIIRMKGQYFRGDIAD